MIHSTLYSCDICGAAYQGTGTGGVTTWSWAGVTEIMDLCPECVARVRESIRELRDKTKSDAAAPQGE